MPPREPQAFPLSSEPSWIEIQDRQDFFTDKELEENVFFTESTIIEALPAEHSRDPIFRDDFLYLCGRLKDCPHPLLLNLLDFGEENGRLYRAWERRPLSLLSFVAVRRGARDKALMRSIPEMFDGLLYLRDLGFPIYPELFRVLSYDVRGVFLARYPHTIKSAFPNAERNQVSFHLHAFCPESFKFFGAPDSLVRADIAFQFQLGTLLWAALSHQMPFLTTPCHAVAKGLELERQPFDFGPTLTPVLLRLTEPDSRKRFPTLEAAFEALRPELERSLAQS